MVQMWECFACHKVLPLEDPNEAKCWSCGSSNGQKISDERLREGLESGAIFNLTGPRSRR